MNTRVLTLIVLSGLVGVIPPPARGSDMAAEPAVPDAERPARVGYEPLQPVSRCLIPQRVRDWAYVSDDRILVNAGRHRYRIDFSYGCPALAFGTSIRFDPGPGTGRMCGHINEAVVVRGSRCNVARIEEIDAETWREIASQPGVALFRHEQGALPRPYLSERSRGLDMDASRSR